MHSGFQLTCYYLTFWQRVKTDHRSKQKINDLQNGNSTTNFHILDPLIS